MLNRNFFFLFAAALTSGFLLANPKSDRFNRPPDFRLVATGGLLGLRDGTEAFYDSALFRLGRSREQKLVIEEASRFAWRFEDTIFIADDLTPADVLAARGMPALLKGKSKAIVGPAVIGLELGDNPSASKFQDEGLRKELAAIYDEAPFEVRLVNNKRVIAVSVSGDGRIDWPADEDDLLIAPAVMAKFNSARLLFVARPMASTARVFGTVDRLLAQSPQIPSRFLDLGNALTGSRTESIAAAQKMRTLLLARKPVVLGSERYDWASQWRDNSTFADAPYIVAASDAVLPNCRMANFGHNALFCAVGEPSEASTAFFPKIAKPLTANQSIGIARDEAEKANINLVFGLAQTPEAISKAISSPIFDAVFSLVSEQQGALPAVDDMDLHPNHEEGLSTVAPLVRVSSNDVTEVHVWVDAQEQIERLRIVRHPVVDEGAMAEDARTALVSFRQTSQLSKPALPARASLPSSKISWSDEELSQILGGLLIESEKADLAIVDQMPKGPTAITSSLPRPVAESLIERPGRAISFEIMGRQLKRILQTIDKKTFEVPVWVVGATLKGPTIQDRKLYDNEWYHLVTTEKVGFAIYRFLEREQAFASAPFLAGVITEHLKNKEPHKTVEEIRKITSAERIRIGDKGQQFAAAPMVADVVEDALDRGLPEYKLKTLLSGAKGYARPTLVLDISDLDLGVNANLINSVVQGWQNQSKNPQLFGISESKMRDPNYVHILVNTRFLLQYSDQNIDTEFESKIRYYHYQDEYLTNPKQRPSEDRVKLTGMVRLPMERYRDVTGPLIYSPAIRLTYETQIWPNPALAWFPESEWPKRGNEARLFLGISAKPQAKDELFRFGALMGYDFNRVTEFNRAAAFGGEIAANYKWTYGVLTLKAESELRLMIPISDPPPDRFGMVWNNEGKAEILAYGNFSVSALASVAVGALMAEPGNIGVATLLGLALSYGDRFKWSF